MLLPHTLRPTSLRCRNHFHKGSPLAEVLNANPLIAHQLITHPDVPVDVMKQFSYQKYYLLCTFNYVCLPFNNACLSFNYVSLSFNYACLSIDYARLPFNYDSLSFNYGCLSFNYVRFMSFNHVRFMSCSYGCLSFNYYFLSCNYACFSFNYYLLSFIYAFLHIIQLWLVAIQLFNIDLPLVPEPAKAPLNNKTDKRRKGI